MVLNYNFKRKKKPTPFAAQVWLPSGLFFVVKVVPSRSELGRKANQIIAMITVGCAKLPQGLKL